MEIRAMTWNLFHGRDFPPDPALFTWRSRLLGSAERNSTHVQLNRDLLDEFAAVLAAARWDVALLQECPPRWSASLAKACDAETQRSLTSRNWLSPIRGGLARRNPDLLGSWEGGSNLTLARHPPAAVTIAERRELVLRRLPERRTMAFARLAGPGQGVAVCVANLHASTRPRRAEEDVIRAAEAAVAWAGDAPLLFGGDLNVRPAGTRLFDELAARFGLAAPTGPDSIDHLLARDLEIVEPPTPWPPPARERPTDGLSLRLSDHAPVAAAFSAPRPGVR